MAASCQRSILSCSRCRRRKMKCDRQLPSCSQCLTAKTSCTGTSSGATTDVPRSIVQHLESEIARLETELVQEGRLEVMQASDILMQMPLAQKSSTDVQLLNAGPNPADDRSPAAIPRHEDESLRVSIVSSKTLQAVVSATLPDGLSAADLLSRVRMGMTPSSAVVAEKNKTPSVNPKANKGNILLAATVLRSIPTDIVQRLVKRYLDTIQRNYPFLVPSVVLQQLRSATEALNWKGQTEIPGPDPSLVAPAHDFLVIYLVLAISVTLGSANHGDEERGMALSLSLFEEGIHHLYGLPSFPSDIAWLQIILLVLLYATVFPRSANVWVLSGAAMRSCLELGLHREPPETLEMSPQTLDLRRRVFWSAYCMDRSICSALQRPLSTPDAAINTNFPSLSPEDAFLGSIAYHQLLSEMLQVHYQREPTPQGLSWEDWLVGMEGRLRVWARTYGETPTSDEMIEFAMARGLMILHRPSPRVPIPSQNSLLIAFEAAAAAARIHNEHIQSGFFRRPWLSAHHTFEAATTVLFCLRHGWAAISDRFSTTQVFEMTKLFTSNFLAIAGRGWPDVSVYAGVYERLLGPLLERVFLRSPTLSDRFGPAQDAELTRLLYPGPSHLEKLRFGLRSELEEFSPFDFNLFMMDDEGWGTELNLTSDGGEETGRYQWGAGLHGNEAGIPVVHQL
ncbi:hypothetical protein GQ53DRAFT_719140 [Thozetella sp. PMI_491]|nr:hypothetical protein GQ53DRAFT_719140 [Thozetella sp. PMI_491]